MLTNDLNHSAIATNFKHRIVNNVYPGRGIVIGRNTAGQWVQVYWIMGRSDNSRNRILTMNNRVLQTQAADPAKLKDPSLVIYNAMREINHCFLVTNGVQTDVIYQGIEEDKTFEESLLTQSHEPDAPNFTPRISGCLDLGQTAIRVKLSLIKASPFNSNFSEHHFFHYQTVEAGYGYALTTYRENGNPLPPFEGVPFVVLLEGNAQEIGNTYWEGLNEANRISLAVKTIDPYQKESALLLINKYPSKQD